MYDLVLAIFLLLSSVADHFEATPDKFSGAGQTAGGGGVTTVQPDGVYCQPAPLLSPPSD